MDRDSWQGSQTGRGILAHCGLPSQTTEESRPGTGLLQSLPANENDRLERCSGSGRRRVEVGEQVRFPSGSQVGDPKGNQKYGGMS